LSLFGLFSLLPLLIRGLLDVERFRRSGLSFQVCLSNRRVSRIIRSDFHNLPSMV